MKDLKMYEAPASEVVELKVSTSLLAGSIQGIENTDDITGGNKDEEF